MYETVRSVVSFLTNVHYDRLLGPRRTLAGHRLPGWHVRGRSGPKEGRVLARRERKTEEKEGGSDAPFQGTQGPRRVTNCNHGQQSAEATGQPMRRRVPYTGKFSSLPTKLHQAAFTVALPWLNPASLSRFLKDEVLEIRIRFVSFKV